MVGSEIRVVGGKWFSLMDKVYATATLDAAWQQVQKNKGSHGVDGMSIELFATKKNNILLSYSRR